VLATVVIILIYRVYVVLYPPPPEEGTVLMPPKPRLPDDPELRGTLEPPAPALRPPMDLPGTYAALYKRNPFTIHSDRAGGDGREVQAKDLDIKLLKIQEGRGRPRAQLQTASARKWYDEGSQFEKFELLEINAEEQTVEVYSEEHTRRFILKME